MIRTGRKILFLLCGSWRSAAQRLKDHAMDDVWQEISTAPYNRDLELAVIEGDHVHPLVFACRRTPSGWTKVLSKERVVISPTHWRIWQGKT
jgi:hypothetical protein